MKAILQENREYLENKEVYERVYYNLKLGELIQSKNVVILQWQRRVGKSSVIVSYLKWNKVDLNTVFYINKELDIRDTISSAEELDQAFEEYKNSFWEPAYIIIDEVQDIDWWERFIRKYNSLKKYNIIITGSNSKLLSWELSTFLTGRYVDLHILPFSYEEFIWFKELDSSEDSFREYIEFWWMPEILFIENIETKKNYLKNVVSNIVLKDIVSRYNIRDIKLIEKILSYLADNIWSLVSITNVVSYLKNQFKKDFSTKTIANYLNYLEFPYIVNEVQRYDLKWKKILEYVWKYYFSDIGIRNSFWFVFAQDIGKVLENLVYLKLKQNGYEIYVWENSQSEIDFVAEKFWEKVYIQVCYLLSSPSVVEREFWNLLEIKDNYRKIVVSMDKTFWNTYSGIEHINIIEWLTHTIV